jgi:regulator of protease activity HflC (stomatin/prohibitin superfamily)
LLDAEARQKATILQAEAQQKTIVLQAQAERQQQVLKAQATAEALQIITKTLQTNPGAQGSPPVSTCPKLSRNGNEDWQQRQ